MTANLGASLVTNLRSPGRDQPPDGPKLRGDRFQRCGVKRTGTDLPPMAAALRMRHAEAAALSVACVRLRSLYL